ncbi:MAG: hypothetical protein JWN75_761 [Candidatus Saccharibacteria bacterium]|nr:hypothetical protein [Candidatus Saccharibacteria bacterium]
MQALYNKSRGFTIVELVVVVSVLGILMGVVLNTLGDFYQSNTTSLGQTNQDTDTRGVMRSIENELTNTTGFSANFSITPTTSFTPLGSKNDSTAWSYLGNDSAKPNNRVLIAGAYATDKAATDDTRTLVYTDTGAGCSDVSTATKVKNTYIYFAAKDSNNQYNLYRRTIVNTTGGTLCKPPYCSLAHCKAPYQTQTCAASLVSLNPTKCSGADAILLKNIDTFTVDYWSAPNDASNYTLAYNTDTAVVSQAARESAINAASSIKITATTTQLINGKSTTNSASLRITKPY